MRRFLCLLFTAALLAFLHGLSLLGSLRPPLFFPSRFSGGKSAACAPAIHPHVLVYNRLEKTGSSTLNRVISALAKVNAFEHLQLLTLYNASFARAAIAAALLRPQRTLISEHFSFPEGAADDARVAFMQVVRAPVSRCTSWYYWSRYSWDNPWTAANRQRFGNATLDACMVSSRPACLNCPPLHQVQSFCGANGGPCFDGSLGAGDVAARAWGNREAHYPVVGLTEAFEDTLEVLEAAFPDFFHGARSVLRQPAFENERVSRGRLKQYVLPSNATRSALARHLGAEEHFYARIKARFTEQLACAHRRT